MLHPQIHEIAAQFKDAGLVVTMETAEPMWLRDLGMERVVDRVYVSEYADSHASDSWLTMPDLDVIVGKIEHRVKPLGKRKCDRGHAATVSYFKHRIYPCCVAWGVKDSPFLHPHGNWPARLDCIGHPCHNCIFGEADEAE